MCSAVAAQKVAKGSPSAMRCIKNKFRFPFQASYAAVASKGKRLKFGFLSLKMLPAQDNCTRFCFVVKKKNGNAVFRNRCRRVLRPIFFNEAENYASPFWIMIIVEMSKINANWQELKKNACSANKTLSKNPSTVL